MPVLRPRRAPNKEFELTTATAALLWLAAAACSQTDTFDSPAATRRYDSAGVTIVLNVEPTDARIPSWYMDSIPSIEIGQSSGEAPYLFSGIAGALRLADGSFLIGDGESSEIRIFDSTGVFVRKFGRSGNGPGEYINFTGVQRYPGDSVLVTDYEGMRARVVALDGREIRRFSPRPHMADDARGQVTTSTRLGVFDDGTLLVGVQTNRCFWDPFAPLFPERVRKAPTAPPGHCEDSTALYSVSQEGEVLHDYGPFHSSRSLSALANNGKRVDFSNIMAPLFLRLSGDRFYYVDSERPEVRVYHRLRGLTHIFRVPAFAGGTRAGAHAVSRQTA
jgi:hypothetical protein